MKNLTFKAVNFVAQSIHTTAVATQVLTEEINGSIGKKLQQGTKSDIISNMREVSDARIHQRLADFKEDLSAIKSGMKARRDSRKPQKVEVLVIEMK